MSAPPIIEVAGLGKTFQLGEIHRDWTAKLADRLRGRRGAPAPVLHALADVDFAVNEGEVFGIIGSNGAGKSTLLKILAGITDPSTGAATLRGRIASLLEVGTGFHPELTGRENVFLNGTILGLRRREIVEEYDRIVDFAGLEKFMDTPVKRYSSGMQVRLAFAVAAHLRPEILLIDEVLAVGDVAFQRKCLGAMQDVASGGRTVLFVSHNMAAVGSLCHRALMLRQGRVAGIGPADEVIQAYIHSTEDSQAQDARGYVSFHPRQPVLPQAPLLLQAARMVDAQGRPVSSARTGESLRGEGEGAGGCEACRPRGRARACGWTSGWRASTAIRPPSSASRCGPCSTRRSATSIPRCPAGSAPRRGIRANWRAWKFPSCR